MYESVCDKNNQSGSGTNRSSLIFNPTMTKCKSNNFQKSFLKEKLFSKSDRFFTFSNKE